MQIDPSFLRALSQCDPDCELDSAHNAYVYLRQRFPGSEPHPGLWRTSSRQRGCSEFRRRARWNRLKDESGNEPLTKTPGPCEELEFKEHRQALQAAIQRLKPMQRQVIERRFYFDESVAEIALSLGRPQNTIYSRLRSAIDALRRDSILVTY